MITIFFFYGLAFILMGIVILAMPKEKDFFNLSDDLWLVGLFGITHGFNEWVDLFILNGKPFDIQMLKVIGALILPISFAFLVAFGARVISRAEPKLKWLKSVWVICLLIWALTYILGKEFLAAGIAARYFICLPGALLTAFALNLKFSKLDKRQLPKVISISMHAAIFAFVLYGGLSGLVVPKANFLLASIINYPNFSNLFGMPVQFFRMICAVILAVCFLGTVGLFYYEKRGIKLRGGIRRKVLLFISSTAIILTITGIGLGYFWGADLLRNTIGEDHKKMAQLLTTSFCGMLDEEIEQTEAYLSGVMLKNTIIKSNLKYENMDTEAIQSYLMNMDKKWIGALDADPLIKEYLESEASIKLKAISKEEKYIAEIFITDRFGGLVASSGITSDFYQADEEWWQVSFNGGKGKVFIGGLEFDESSKTLAIIFAVPVKDREGKVIGISKAVINAKTFFAPLENFRIGDTGHAVLVNKKGYILFHQGAKPLSERFCDQETFQRLLKSERKWEIIDCLELHSEKSFLAFEEIRHPLLLERGLEWIIFVDQAAREAFLPLNRLIFQMLMLVGILISILISLGLILSRVFTRPIEKLCKATDKIAGGDLDYRVEIKTGDEIEELASSIGEMVSNIKEKQKTILQEKAYSEGIISSMIDSLIVVNLDGTIRTVNRATCELLGYKEEELIGQPVKKIFAGLLEKDRSGNYEASYISKDGRKIPVLFSSSAMKDKGGNVNYLVCAAIDITVRKLMEEELYKIDRTLKTISECNQMLVRVTNESALLFEICRIIVEVGGYRLAWVGFAEQDENKTVRPVAQMGFEEGYLDTVKITWADNERGRGPTGRAIRIGKPCIIRDILKDPNYAPWRDEALKRGYVSSIALPLIASGTIIGALNIYSAKADAFDPEEVKMLTELADDLAYGLLTLRTRVKREEAEKALEESEKWTRAIWDYSRAAIMVIDEESHKIVDINSIAAEIIGAAKGEIIGQVCHKFVCPAEVGKCPISDLGQTVDNSERVIINVNGESIPIIKTVTSAMLKGRRYLIESFIDISERKKEEETQRLAELGKLVADVAHEVNNPLMVISGRAQLSLMEDIKNEELKKNLGTIFEQSQRASDIIQRLLKFSRPSKGKLKQADINKVIEEVVSILENQFKLINIEIKRNYAQNLPPVSIDDKQIQEVFMNLLNNSKDAIPESGIIEIATSYENDFLKIDLKDTGVGMSQEALDKIFTPFFTTKEKGTGLGLSVSHSIIKAHNGELRFKSSLNQGTTATILLPIKEAKDNV